FNDRAFVQVTCDKVCRCPNEFHPALKSLMVRFCAFKARQEGMVNIDSATRELLAEVVGKDLHVTGKNDQFSLGFIDNLEQFRFLLFFTVLGDWQIDKADTFTLSNWTQIQVIGNNRGDFKVQFTLVMAVK